MKRLDENQAKLKKDNCVRHDFECGCFTLNWVKDGELHAGLACCNKHEKGYRQLEEILPLTLVKVTYKP